MIDVMRLDERLIHGQVAVWTKGASFDTLLVVDDESANDKFLTNTLYMAAPSNLKTFVMTNEAALNVLCDPRCKTRHVFVVVKTIDTLLNIAQKAPDIAEIVVSNYGRMVTSSKDRKSYTSNMFLDEDEAAKLKTLTTLGIPCYEQMTASGPKTPLENILKNA